MQYIFQNIHVFHAVLCFIVVLLGVDFVHILQSYFASTGAIM